MDKPDSEKCRQCNVKHNKLRCSLCKYKTEEWYADYISSVLVFGNNDNFVSKGNRNERLPKHNRTEHTFNR